MLPLVQAIRYIAPFREGGSLPTLVEADDGRMYVVKMRGAGQGTLALVAEIITGEIARLLGLPVPRLALVALHEAFGKNEPDAEIQDLLRASVGLNVGLEFLPAATTFDAAAGDPVTALEASLTVWLDAFTLNVDRTFRNPNLLRSGDRLWLIDHGASLYMHHNWPTAMTKTALPFTAIAQHVLLRQATAMAEARQVAHRVVTDAVLAEIVDLVPEDMLVAKHDDALPEERRRDYLRFLSDRLAQSAAFEQEIDRARTV